MPAKNGGKQWTPSEESKLKALAKGNTPTRLIAHKLGRTAGSVYAKANSLDVSLKPTNQSPYNRKK